MSKTRKAKEQALIDLITKKKKKPVIGVYIVGEKQPKKAKTGDVWFNSDTGVVSIYYNYKWVILSL